MVEGVEQPWPMLVLAMMGGVVAGVINTLAGSGSLVTLPILAALGLPAPVANATNRVGVVIQSIVGVETMRRTGQLEPRGSAGLVVANALGAALGAWLASKASAQVISGAIGAVMAAMLVVLLARPKRWEAPTDEAALERRPAWLLALFFGVGVYGGFIQAGVGVMLLMGLVMGARYSVRHGNGVKLIMALVATLVAMLVFWWEGLVVWPLGLLMGAGQALGAWLAARHLMRHERAAIWVRRLLIAVVLWGVARFWGLWAWALSWWTP